MDRDALGKRDNDLMPFAGLPKRVTLKFRRGPEFKDGAWHVGRCDGDAVRREYVGEVDANDAAWYFKWEVTPPTSPRAILGFVTSRAQSSFANVWRARAAALDSTTGQVIPLFHVLADRFAQLPGGAFELRWSVSVEEQMRLKQYCSPEGATRYATSIWFEDIVGHVSVPEALQWLKDRRSPKCGKRYG